ncbi:MAG: transposase [Pirellulaceae bacterium]
MTRPKRSDEADGIYHVLNRGNARQTIFHKPQDYAAFERILGKAIKVHPVELFAYQLMPNHWHLVLRPTVDGQMGRMMRYLTMTHTMRYHTHFGTVGEGHVYQGRFKSFQVQEDAHFFSVCRYVERNAVRSGLVDQAEDWQWGSLWRSQQPIEPKPKLLTAWPLFQPKDWGSYVNQPQNERELAAIHQSIKRGSPFGDSQWVEATAKQSGLESTLRSRGRPKSQNR